MEQGISVPMTDRIKCRSDRAASLNSLPRIDRAARIRTRLPLSRDRCLVGDALRRKAGIVRNSEFRIRVAHGRQHESRAPLDSPRGDR